MVGWVRDDVEMLRLNARARDVRWGPRTLDVDVVSVDGVTSDDPELLLPHPGTAERASVLRPWLDACGLLQHGHLKRLRPKRDSGR